MRLIDADALEKEGLMMVKLSDKEDKLLTKFEWKDVPTAYDVEAVVAELEKKKDVGLNCWECSLETDEGCIGNCVKGAFREAISIVRGKE